MCVCIKYINICGLMYELMAETIFILFLHTIHIHVYVYFTQPIIFMTRMWWGHFEPRQKIPLLCSQHIVCVVLFKYLYSSTWLKQFDRKEKWKFHFYLTCWIEFIVSMQLSRLDNTLTKVWDTYSLLWVSSYRIVGLV